MLDWKMDWNGGLVYGMDYGIFIFHSTTKLCFVANQLMSSSTLYCPAFMQPPQSCRGQSSHAYLISFNGCILYIASKQPYLQ